MRAKIPSKLIVIFLFLTILISGWLYRDSFNSYFFQDDWFTLRISNARNISDILRFFIPRTDIIYYRPLGMQIPFFVLRSIFGVNPLPFRILTFLTHAVNIVFIFILIRLLSKSDNIALLSSFLYGTSAVHYTIFFWSSIYPFIAGPTAFFLSFILYLLFLRKKRKKYYFLSLIVFILGLLVDEMVAVLPIILFLYSLIYKKRIETKSFLPYTLFVVLLLTSRFFMFPPPTSGSYQLGLGKNIFSNLKTYILWSFNWSEIITEQMVHLFIFNSKFIKEFSNYALVSLLAFFISLLFFYVLPIVSIIYKKNKEFWPLIIFGTTWFVVGLSPVLFFHNHKFSYYLPISLVGLLLFSTSLFNFLIQVIKRQNKWVALIVTLVLLANWLFISVTSIDFNSKVHWAPRRTVRSKVLVEKAKQFYSPPLVGTYIIYVHPSSENKLSLNDQEGLQIIFNNSDIVTIYTNNIKGKKIL